MGDNSCSSLKQYHTFLFAIITGPKSLPCGTPFKVYRPGMGICDYKTGSSGHVINLQFEVIRNDNVI